MFVLFVTCTNVVTTKAIVVLCFILSTMFISNVRFKASINWHSHNDIFLQHIHVARIMRAISTCVVCVYFAVYPLKTFNWKFIGIALITTELYWHGNFDYFASSALIHTTNWSYRIRLNKKPINVHQNLAHNMSINQFSEYILSKTNIVSFLRNCAINLRRNIFLLGKYYLCWQHFSEFCQYETLVTVNSANMRQFLCWKCWSPTNIMGTYAMIWKWYDLKMGLWNDSMSRIKTKIIKFFGMEVDS